MSWQKSLIKMIEKNNSRNDERLWCLICGGRSYVPKEGSQPQDVGTRLETIFDKFVPKERIQLPSVVSRLNEKLSRVGDSDAVEIIENQIKLTAVIKVNPCQLFLKWNERLKINFQLSVGRMNPAFSYCKHVWHFVSKFAADVKVW